MAGIHITDIESAINYWRDKAPPGDGISLSPEVRALAEVYAQMVYFHETLADDQSFPKKAYDAWLAWYQTTPDTPCIAICSTSQGDNECKGCGRSFEEVQRWPELRPAEKREVWHRIQQEGLAWRFNRYSERAAERQRPTPAAEGAPSSAPGPVPSSAPSAGAEPGTPPPATATSSGSA